MNLVAQRGVHSPHLDQLLARGWSALRRPG